MSFDPRFIAVGSAAIALIAVAPSAQALTGQEVNDVAREITTLIHGRNGSFGSGVIVSKNNQTYFVLTAHHVVRTKTDYKLIAPDQKTYEIDAKKTVVLPGIDLALVAFTSDRNYAVAKIGTAKTSPGQEVFVSGWPSLGAVGNAAGGELIRQFTDGRISGALPKPYRGYQMIYTNITRAGMSGGGVFDAGGRLVGIHGLGEKEDAKRLVESGINESAAINLASQIKPGFNFAIPIEAFLKKSKEADLYLSLQIERDPAPELGAKYVASREVDERDKISDFQKTLNTIYSVNRTVNDVTDTVRDGRNTIDRFRGTFGF